MEPRRGAHLTETDQITIALCRNAKIRKKTLSKHFDVSVRQIERIDASFPVKFKTINEALCAYNKLLDLEMQSLAEVEVSHLEISDPHSAAADSREQCTNHVQARTVVMINQLKRQIRIDKLHLARLKAIRDRERAEQQGHCDSHPEVSTEPSEDDSNILEEIQHLATITPKARRYSDRLMRFAYCLMTYSPVAYKFIRSALPLPSRSQIYVRFSDLVAQMKQSLTNVDEVYRLVEDLGKHADHQASPKIVCTLGVDAFAFRLFLRPSAAISELRTKLRPRDIYTLSPILEDKELVRIFEEDEMSEEDWEEWPDPGESEVYQQKIGELFNIYNSCFIFVLLPLDCDIPCITLHLEPASSGSANERTATILQQLVEKCALYNIDIPYIAADGDSAWNVKFHNVFSIMQKLRFNDFNNLAMDLYNECRARGIQLPITDPLHYVKSARSKYIRKVIAVTRADLNIQTDCTRAEELLQVGLALSDKSQIGKMRDYYPLELFTVSNVLKLLEAELYADAFFFAPHTLLLLAIRVPFFTLKFRLSLLGAAYLLFYEVYVDVSSEMPRSVQFSPEHSTPKVTQRDTSESDMVTFAEVSALKRILCTLLAMGSALQIHPDNLRTDSLGTHIVEQKIGQGREDCDARWERILSRFSRNSLRTVCLELDGIEMAVPGRLKTAGCRVTSDADWEIPEFDALLFSRVFVHSLTEVGRAEESFASAFKSVKAWLTKIAEVVRDRVNEIGKVWMPNPAANSSIMARLLQSSLQSYQIKQ